MKLIGAHIENYRSIDLMDLSFEQGCLVLIGINESGKSNILRALQLLDQSITPKTSDLRLERRNEPPVTEGVVRFRFSLEDADIEKILPSVLAKFDASSLDFPVVFQGGTPLKITEFARMRATGLYEIHLPSGKRRANFWALPAGNNLRAMEGWQKNITDTVLSMTANDERVIKVPAQGYFFVAESADGPQSKAATAEMFNAAVGISVREYIENNLPKCIFWKYSDEYLLPASIDVSAFAANPDSCIPLKSMFELASYPSSKIAETISTAKSQSHHRYFQLLERVGEAGTKHLRAAWRDHKGVSIELRPNGDALVPVILDDQVPMDMSSRSDGFKRFVSFLLQVSAKIRTKEFAGIVLLVDEPEIALHPGGARSLAKELSEIGAGNTVVYSTHSIFMVDRKNIARHLIVEKKEEVTSARTAEPSRIQEEEVLYAAMGYSIFEALRENNVIFEGWRDREIYRVASDAAMKSDKALRAQLDTIGATFADGAKDVKHVARFLELARRGCLIISDADTPAQEKRKEYLKLGAWGKWVTIAEIIGDAVSTAEDLFVRASLMKRANKFRATMENLPAIVEAHFRQGEPALGALKRWLKDSGLEGKALEEALNELKKALFRNLKREELVPDVDKLVEFVRSHNYSTS